MTKVEFYSVTTNEKDSRCLDIIYLAKPEKEETLKQIEEYCDYIELVEGNFSHYTAEKHIAIFQSEGSNEITSKDIEWWRDWHQSFVNDYIREGLNEKRTEYQRLISGI